MTVNEKLSDSNNLLERDGVALPVDPYAAYGRGDTLPVDMLTGTNTDELRYGILDAGELSPYRVLGRILFGCTEKQPSGQYRQKAEAFLRMQAKKGLRGRLCQITEFFNEPLFRLPAVRQGEAHAAHGSRAFRSPLLAYRFNGNSIIPSVNLITLLMAMATSSSVWLAALLRRVSRKDRSDDRV